MIPIGPTRLTSASPLPATGGPLALARDGDDGPPRGPWRRTPWRLPPAALTLGALLAIWLVWYPHSPDLAAQAYRTHLFSVDGFTLWDNNWYAGHYLLDYSVLFPPLGALLGLRAIGAIAVTLSTVMFARLARDRFGSHAAAASALFAIGAAGDLYIGRLTYALGVTFAVAAVLAIVRGHYRLAALLSLACGATSPVAALFLALAAGADLLANRALGRAVVLAGPAVALTLALTLLFSDGGYETFSLTSLLAATASTLMLVLLLPARERLLRTGALLYLATLLLAYLARSPLGSNAVRLGVLLAPALLVGSVTVDDARIALSRSVRAQRRRAAHDGGEEPSVTARTARVVLYAATAAIVLWQVNGPLVQSVTAAADPSTQLSYYAPVTRFLAAQQGDTPMRIEVAFTSSHWDATVLARRFDLARGWERQLDLRYDGLFYGKVLTASAYQQWLLDTGVRFVVLSDARLDPSSVAEAELIRGGLPFLRQVFSSAHWRVYAVAGARPLASGPGRLTALDGDGFALRASGAGMVLVRVRYTPFWRVTSGAATVSPSPDDWTDVTVSRAGPVLVEARL